MNINDLFIEIIDYINKHIYEDITIDELSLYFGYEKSYLMKAFKKKIGLPIKGYINNRKIMNVLNNLKEKDSLLKVALNNGFNSLEYFSETFKKIIGVSPIIYKKYLSYKYISDKDQEKILFNVSRISSIKSNTLNYLNHRKPTVSSYVKRIEFKQ